MLKKLLGLEPKHLNYVSTEYIDRINDPTIKEKLIDMNKKMNPIINDKRSKRQLELTYVCVLMLIIHNLTIRVTNNNYTLHKDHPKYKQMILNRENNIKLMYTNHKYLTSIARSILISVNSISEYFSREFSKIITENIKDMTRAFAEIMYVIHNENGILDITKIRKLFSRNEIMFSNMFVITMKSVKNIKTKKITYMSEDIKNQYEEQKETLQEKIKNKKNIKKMMKNKKKNIRTEQRKQKDAAEGNASSSDEGHCSEFSSEDESVDTEEKYKIGEYKDMNNNKEATNIMKAIMVSTIVLVKIGKTKIDRASKIEIGRAHV